MTKTISCLILIVFFPFQEETIRIFEAHRNQFLADDDLQKIAAKLGWMDGHVGSLVMVAGAWEMMERC